MAVKRVCSLFLLYTLTNLWILFTQLHVSQFFNTALVFVLAVFFLYYNVNPGKYKGSTGRIKVMRGGRELFIIAFLLLFLEIILYSYLIFFSKVQFHPTDLIINGVICLALLLVLVWNGIIRLICASTQLSLFARLALFFAWWVPIANIFLVWHCCHVTHNEYLFDMGKRELDESRKENEICKTKYPILLVHEIFWRDWQLFNYWGRIPKELK